MNLRRVKAIAWKEALHILRDARSLVMALALPAFMLLLFGYALTLDVDRIPTVVMDRDGSPDSREVVSRFDGSRYFTVMRQVAEFSEIEEMIDRGRCMVGIVIPARFGRDLRGGASPELQLVMDGSDSNTASISLGYAQAILEGYAVELQRAALVRVTGISLETPVQLRSRVWHNSELKSKNYIVPGLLAVIMMIIAAQLTTLTVAREWELGTMEQLMSTPVRPTELLLGKMSAYFGLAAADTFIAIVLGVVVFDVPFRGGIGFMALNCFLFIVGALCWGIFLSASTRSQLYAYQLGMLSSFLPTFLLSGFVYAIRNMPVPVQLVTYLVPARYFIVVARGVLLKGVGAEILLTQTAFLLVFALVVFLAATRKLKGKVA